MHSGSTSAKVDDKNQRTFTATSYPICRLVLLAVQMFFFCILSRIDPKLKFDINHQWN